MGGLLYLIKVTVVWMQFCFTCPAFESVYETSFYIGAETEHGCKQLRKAIRENWNIVLPKTLASGMKELEVTTSKCAPY